MSRIHNLLKVKADGYVRFLHFHLFKETVALLRFCDQTRRRNTDLERNGIFYLDLTTRLKFVTF